MSRRALVGWARTSTPATTARPASGISKVVRMRTAVVFPAPFGPSRPRIVPAGATRSMPSSAVTSLKRLRSRSTSIAASVIQSTVRIVENRLMPPENRPMPPLNISDPEFTYDAEDPEGYRAGMFRIGPNVGAERTGATLYHLPPGELLCPYHYEYGEEEWLLVLTGRPFLRTPDGTAELKPMDIAFFPR